MATHQEYQNFQDRAAATSAEVVDRIRTQLIENPALADALVGQIEALLEAAAQADAARPSPGDGGLAQLIGLGRDAATDLGETWQPFGVEPYDETLSSAPIISTALLYYLFQMEMIGVFKAVLILKNVFDAGVAKVSARPGEQGGYWLYTFDRKQVLRYTQRERMQTYRRVFGYTNAPPPPGAQPNRPFHSLFTQFNWQVSQFFRDKRVSEVIRPRATDPSFGSIAVVRRAGLDLRNNLKNASYGNVGVLAVELMQLLQDAFRILNAPDIRRLFGADNAWDTLEEVLRRYTGQVHIPASQRSRMGSAGREIIQWLAQPHILNNDRAEFEALLAQIANDCEEWLMSAQSLPNERPTIVAQPGQVSAKRSGSRLSPNAVPRVSYEEEWQPEIE